MAKSLVPVSLAAVAALVALVALAALAVTGASGCAANPGDPADSADPAASVRAQSSIIAVVDGTLPTLSYSSVRPLETDPYPRLPTLTLRMYESASIAYLGVAPVVKYQLTYQALSDASGAATVTPLEQAFNPVLPPLDPPIGGPGFPPVQPPQPSVRTLRIDPNGASRNFLPYTVYRLRFQLFNIAGGALGPQSDWFYAVTAGTSTSPSDTLEWGRVDMVLRALDQLGDAQDGLIGPGGTEDPDGTRYVSVNHRNYNPGDELTGWCDWFYHYLGVMVTDGLDGHLAADPVADGGNEFWKDAMNPNNVPNAFRDPLNDGCGTERVDLDHNGRSNDTLYAGCQDHTTSEITLDTDDNRFYSNISDNIYHDATRSLPQNQGLGNYQAMDSHAGMFLAFDPNGDGTFSGSGTVGTVWSIEGNVSDTVRIMHRAANSTVINGFGKLTAAMFEP